ncbi:hypothetical protein ACCO45_000983 [Purpureocillium lilacinum]|uniref:Uncharacterized protein n=1 Tax=Purpureocillium lilacinum TaxID=33203 RepID=A0ACC4E5R3_PURLI
MPASSRWSWVVKVAVETDSPWKAGQASLFGAGTGDDQGGDGTSGCSEPDPGPPTRLTCDSSGLQRRGGPFRGVCAVFRALNCWLETARRGAAPIPPVGQPPELPEPFHPLSLPSQPHSRQHRRRQSMQPAGRSACRMQVVRPSVSPWHGPASSSHHLTIRIRPHVT